MPIFLREHFNGMYRVDVYYITKQLAELPFFLVTPVLFVAIFYYMVGLNPTFDRFAYACLIVTVLTQVVVSYGETEATILGIASSGFPIPDISGPEEKFPGSGNIRSRSGNASYLLFYYLI